MSVAVTTPSSEALDEAELGDDEAGTSEPTSRVLLATEPFGDSSIGPADAGRSGHDHAGAIACHWLEERHGVRAGRPGMALSRTATPQPSGAIHGTALSLND